jgi:hypothetical protein
MEHGKAASFNPSSHEPQQDASFTVTDGTITIPMGTPCRLDPEQKTVNNQQLGAQSSGD